MQFLMKVILSFVFPIVCSCAFNQLNYPYAENNTTVETYFNYHVSDDYQWLELDYGDSAMRKKWLDGQILLKSNYFKDIDSLLIERIKKLSGIPNTKTFGVLNDTIYFFKLYQSTNVVEFCKFINAKKETHLIKSFVDDIYINHDLKASVSPSGDKIAIVNRLDNEKNTILIYDLKSDSLFRPHGISDVMDYSPIWIGNGIVYNEISAAGGSNVCYYDLEAEDPNKTVIYEGALPDSLVHIDLAMDRRENQLYISEFDFLSKNKFSIYSVSEKDLLSNRKVNLFTSFSVDPHQNIRMGGVDNENIYLVDYNSNIRGRVVALNKKEKTYSSLIEDSLVSLSSINLIKDHVVVSFQNMKENKAYLIHNKNFSVREIGINQDGRYTFVNNKEDSLLFLVEESVIEPKTLFKTSSVYPEKVELVTRLKNLPFNPDNYVIEHVTIDNGADSTINLVLSYKKGLKLNGKNPLIYYCFPNGGDGLMNKFSFGRILFMEQGFILAQRSTNDYSQFMSIEKQTKDLFSVVDFLCEKEYTSPDRLCLTGIELGSTVVANALNEKPDLCSSVIYVDGIFDLVRHHKLDNMYFEKSFLFRFKNKEELKNLLSYSPYHNIKSKKSYPSMLFIVNKEKRIAPSHSFKYAAKVQMRTKAENPVILLSPKQRGDQNKAFARDCNYHYSRMLMFLDETLDLDLYNEGIFK